MAVWDSAKHGTPSPHSHPWLADALFAFDTRLRRRSAVIEYSNHPSCIFRLDIARVRQPVTLRDGTRLNPGERMARLHFWNEQVPAVPRNGTTIGWARRMQQSIALSLRELARYLALRPDLRDITMICGDVPSGTKAQSRQLAYIIGYYGFEAIAEQERLSIGERIHRLAENILISLIVFAHNARTLRRDTLSRARLPIYLSRRALDERFGGANASAS